MQKVENNMYLIKATGIVLQTRGTKGYFLTRQAAYETDPNLSKNQPFPLKTVPDMDDDLATLVSSSRFRSLALLTGMSGEAWAHKITIFLCLLVLQFKFILNWNCILEKHHIFNV